jgi:hypothetical protein
MSRTALAVSLALAALALPATAQDAPDPEAMMQAWQEAMTPGPEHERLAGLAGTWKTTTTVEGIGEGADESYVGVAEREMDFDGRVLVGRLSTEMMGMPMSGMAMSGYDNVTGRYWGTWTDNMSTGVILLWGSMDASGGVMEGEYSEAMTGTRETMRIETAFDGPDRQVDTFYMPGPDGEMFKSMEVVYERQ